MQKKICNLIKSNKMILSSKAPINSDACIVDDASKGKSILVLCQSFSALSTEKNKIINCITSMGEIDSFLCSFASCTIRHIKTNSLIAFKTFNHIEYLRGLRFDRFVLRTILTHNEKTLLVSNFHMFSSTQKLKGHNHAQRSISSRNPF